MEFGDGRRNRLLQSVEPGVLATLHGALAPVRLEAGEVLQRDGDAIEHVYFPEGALIGLISPLPEGEALQTSMVGWEGAVGAFEACGSRQTLCRIEVQIGGLAWRMTATGYRGLFDASPPFRTAMHKYVELLLAEARQFIACNALHPVDARLARCILEAAERSGSKAAIRATQQGLSDILGVQRTTITSAIGQLERTGAIRGRRGFIEILDGGRLEQAACSCRAAIQEAQAEIWGSPEPSCEALVGGDEPPPTVAAAP